MSQLDIRLVNKYETSNNWIPETMFSGFKIRAVLHKQQDIISHASELYQLRKRLSRELGVEDVDWILGENPRTLVNELYLQNSGRLVMWKLQDNEKFTELFDFVEQHTDDQDKLDEQEREDAAKAAKAREEERLAREAAQAEYQKKIDELMAQRAAQQQGGQARPGGQIGPADDDDDDDGVI